MNENEIEKIKKVIKKEIEDALDGFEVKVDKSYFLAQGQR
jgi:hypothetical protein